ncbi:MAG: glycosyltransferase family 2 protein [Thermoplasmata archaeon]
MEAVVILPTLNEEGGLARTLDEIPFGELRAAGHKIAAVVIDGGSKDRTLDVARQRGVTILHQKSRGKGGAVREALAYVRTQGARYAVVMDADSTYPGDAVGPAISLLRSGSQLVVGIRSPDRTLTRAAREIIHRVGNNLLNYVATRLSHRPILDVCSGFWSLDLSVGLDLELESLGFDIEAELFMKAYQRGYTVTQFPISYGERVGAAKLHAAQDGIRILLTLLRVGPAPRRGIPEPGARSGSLLGDLLSITLVTGTSELVLVSAPSRLAEAERLARGLRGSGVEPKVVVQSKGASVSQMLDREFAADPSANPSLATVIALPPPSVDPNSPEARAVVLLPKSRRLVYVSDVANTSISGARTTLPGSSTPMTGSYLLEYRPEQSLRLRWGLGLGAQISGSPDAKELIMLGANSTESTVTVFKQPPGPRTSPDRNESSAPISSNPN